MAAAVDVAREWLVAFQSCVRRLDFAGARELFDLRVLGFGSAADQLLQGLDALEQNQWRRVWPNIEGFTFEIEDLRVFGNGDGVGLAVPWTSTGLARNGGRFSRRGRATLMLRKGSESWLCCHSHFSLFPGASQDLR